MNSPDAGGIVLYETHLRADGHDAGHRDVEEASARLLVFGQQVVQHAKQLQHTLLPPVKRGNVIDEIRSRQ